MSNTDHQIFLSEWDGDSFTFAARPMGAMPIYCWGSNEVEEKGPHTGRLKIVVCHACFTLCIVFTPQLDTTTSSKCNTKP